MHPKADLSRLKSERSDQVFCNFSSDFIYQQCSSQLHRQHHPRQCSHQQQNSQVVALAYRNGPGFGFFLFCFRGEYRLSVFGYHCISSGEIKEMQPPASQPAVQPPTPQPPAPLPAVQPEVQLPAAKLRLGGKSVQFHKIDKWIHSVPFASSSSSSSSKQNELQLDAGNGIAEEDIGEHDQSSPASDEDKMPEVAVAAASSGTNLNPDQDSSPNPEDGSSHRSRRRKKISFSETSKQWIWAQCSKHGYGDLVEG